MANFNNDTQGGSWQTLVAADNLIIQQLTAALIAKSDGRPGGLLAIGRRLVNKCITVKRRLSAREMEEVLQEMDHTA